ncbi:preprotein translocase subunit YajC [Streptomyces alkaliterrae]|uniref:Preprotein translocase subunit YajC n=1 Tax=Streptomyces alkaliterrae TaxID=2213162 RepID=A0A5P0YPI8_9ACTN|nr:preprotein translocase subunit YajC [Streptomyces alkaliterrae]MBB1255945.1 preprotein translocase subunit YajC [Streptomyces alkaliterrae]MBB1260376.1 preprotein translocase subunit YajC [Streptomyces alkaliterrae]MQS02201.1 preprotein translocase subunit YajC [Streptomyces alkaliterrae]
MDIAFLLPFIVLIGAMFLMTRSAKKKQEQAMKMRDQVQPGTGVRTIGGLYGKVKEVGDDTVLLEVAPGVSSLFAKNAIGAILEDDEYEAIVNPETRLDEDTPVVPDDASSLTATEDTATAGDDKPNLVKDADADAAETPKTTGGEDADETKKDGESGSK